MQLDWISSASAVAVHNILNSLAASMALLMCIYAARAIWRMR